MSLINKLIKAPTSRVFKKAYIKRRIGSTGLFESGWLDVSTDIKSYGKITNKIDTERRYKLTFGTAKLVFDNSQGRYNPSNDQGSLWNGYLSQQRTLVKIEAGFISSTQDTNGVNTIYELPEGAVWDYSRFDLATSIWDSEDSSTVFTGIISGDITFSDSNEVVFNLKPLQSVFQDYPARNLTGWTSTGMSASQFITMVRDQTDGAGSFVFRPFFNDTTTQWDISTTSNVFLNLNTSGAKDIVDKNVWEVIEKLSEVENFIAYVDKSGKFKFINRSNVGATTAFEFHGTGSFSSTYGHTIKKINSYGFKASKYYSRVQIKFNDTDTITSYYTQEATLTVGPTNGPWLYGAKTLAIENYYIQNTATASNLATTVFNDVTGIKNEIEFDTTFIPHLNLFDKVTIHYDPNPFITNNLWDHNYWAADNTSTASDLIFDSSNYDSLAISGQEFKFLSFEIDLDNFQNKFIAREI
jgi:hypothetical protein